MGIQRVPGKGEMKAYLLRGYTQQQIVEAWYEDSGERVSRSAIAMAMRRYNLEANNEKQRHEDLVPWKLRPEHRMHNDARMLRLESKRRSGKKIGEAQARWVDNWLSELRRLDAVVSYEPDTEEGFFWVPRAEANTDGPEDIIDRPFEGPAPAQEPVA